MNMHIKPDWIGTPRVQGSQQFSVDFTLPDDDNRYKLLVTGDSCEIKKYGVRPGLPKPFLLDTSCIFEHEMPPLVHAIVHDAYVKAVLEEKQA